MNDTKRLSREILEALHDEAFKWAMSCCGYDYDEAREIMQSVYVEILSEKAVYRGESSLRTWLFSVIRRVAWRRLRSRRFIAQLKSNFSRLVLQQNHAVDANENLDRQLLSGPVGRALSGLSEKQRQIIELVYYRGFTLAEAAGIMGIGLGSVRTHFHRAKQTLARQLAELKEE